MSTLDIDRSMNQGMKQGIEKDINRHAVKPRLGPHPSWAQMREQSRSLCLAWSERAGGARATRSDDGVDAADRRDDYIKSNYFFKF